MLYCLNMSKLIQHLKYYECKEKEYSAQMKIMWCNVLVYFHMMHMYSCCFAPPLCHYFPNQSGDLKSTLSQTWFLNKLQETPVSRVKTHGFLQHFHKFALNQLTFRLLFPGVRPEAEDLESLLPSLFAALQNVYAQNYEAEVPEQFFWSHFCLRVQRYRNQRHRTSHFWERFFLFLL